MRYTHKYIKYVLVEVRSYNVCDCVLQYSNKESTKWQAPKVLFDVEMVKKRVGK